MLPYLPLPSKAEQQFGWGESRGAGTVAAFTRKKVIGASAPVASKMEKGGKNELKMLQIIFNTIIYPTRI